MYPYVVKTEYYDDEDKVNKKLNCLIYGNDFSDVCKRIVRYCDPDHIEINCVGDEYQLFEVPEYIADTLIKGDGNYDDGVENMNCKE